MFRDLNPLYPLIWLGVVLIIGAALVVFRKRLERWPRWLRVAFMVLVLLDIAFAVWLLAASRAGTIGRAGSGDSAGFSRSTHSGQSPALKARQKESSPIE